MNVDTLGIKQIETMCLVEKVSSFLGGRGFVMKGGLDHISQIS